MCRFANRIERLEKEVAYWKGVESQEPIIGRMAGEIAELRARNGDLRTDLKLCRKPDGEVMLRPSHLAQSFRDEPRVLTSHPPLVEIERHRQRENCCDEGRHD
jgi:hypothetical protein